VKRKQENSLEDFGKIKV